jgi:hypothetical protein
LADVILGRCCGVRLRTVCAMARGKLVNEGGATQHAEAMHRSCLAIERYSVCTGRAVQHPVVAAGGRACWGMPVCGQ